jgi:signal transduction histidine kinase
VHAIARLAWISLVIAGGVGFAPGRSHAAEPPRALTTLRAVGESFLEPGPHGPVDVEAVVTGYLQAGSIALRDETGATFASLSDRELVSEPGDRVRVRGTVRDGAFINGIAVETMERLDRGPAPAPRSVGPADLAAGAFYHDLVTASGVIRSVRQLGKSKTVVVLNVDGGTIEVRYEWLVSPEEAARLVDAEVTVTGFGAGETNAARQLIRPFVRVVDSRALQITKPANADPFAIPATPLELVSLGLQSGHRRKIVGVATARGGVGEGVFLAAGDHGLFVMPAEIEDTVRAIAPGDRVEAVGFATPGPVSLVLGDAVVRVIGTAPVPPARPLPDVSSDRLPSDEWNRLHQAIWRDALPLEAEIDVASRIDRGDATEIVGTTPVRKVAIRCLATQPPPGAVPGSRVRVRGVGLVTATDRDMFRPMPVAFDVWPSTDADVVVVGAAPWWLRPGVVRTLVVTLAGSALAVMGTAAWVVVLRRQVRRQVGIIEGQLRTEAVMEERQRIAREFHDSLEQDLAAMALRLDAAAEATADHEAHDVLADQRAAVLRLQDESHQFVWDLRDAALAERPLAESLAALVEDLRHLSPAPIGLRIAGSLPNPPLAARQQLLRIVREAVANAVSHAHAATIEVVASAVNGRVAVEVRDDGEGFDVAACERRAGHFGLRGMRERAWRVGAMLDIESSPRSGSRVAVAVDAERPQGDEPSG